MAEKSLSEGDWKSFAKARKLDDSKEAFKDSRALHDAVLEALQELARKDEDKHEDMLSALDKLEAALNKQVIANAKRKDKGGKAVKDIGEVKDQLHKMLAALEKQRKALREAKSPKDAAADEDEESPALLTSKMIPLVRQVRKGDVVLQALVAVAGKETVVLLSRRAISPARGKLLKDQMSIPGGLKFIRGECLWEQNALTFVVQAAAGGLAKKIKAALLAQTELRMKVRVRGEDPDDLDEEGEENEVDDATAVQGAGTAEAPSAADSLQARFDERLGRLEAPLSAALRKGAGDVSRLRAVSAFAREKAKTGAYAAGLQTLDALEKLLAATAVPAAATEAAHVDGDPLDPGVAFTARVAALMPSVKAAAQEVRAKVSEAGFAARKHDYAGANALLDEVEGLLGAGPAGDIRHAEGDPLSRWKSERASAIASLKEMANRIAAARHSSSAKAIIEIQSVIKNLSAHPSTLHQISELQIYLGTDDVVQDVCELAEDIREPLLGALGKLRVALGS